MKMVTAATLSKRFAEIREWTMKLVEPLEKEDFVIQSHPDVSPPKWHLAHTTWFFERMVLKEFQADYQEFNAAFDFLFNSYYNSIGPYQPRQERGVLSRPTIDEVIAYRAYVNEQMHLLLAAPCEPKQRRQMESVIELGLQHEQQHQELILMDVKYNFFANPLLPAYTKTATPADTKAGTEFISFSGGLVEIGHEGSAFSFDNERPRHKVWIEPFKLASKPVTCGEYAEFIEAGGYEKPEYWLSDGWTAVQQNNWKAPLYWIKTDQGHWRLFTFSGMQDLKEHEPVCHVSFYEADAFSRWKNKRLPTEAEWEHAANGLHIQGNTLEKKVLHPLEAENKTGLSSMFGNVWEWTASPYAPYPKSKPLDGALGEYNAKFMCNQMVLRGGSFATPANHIRATYRNFFQPDKRWQFSGFRLAEDES